MMPRLLDGNSVPYISISVDQNLTPLSNATMEVLKEDALPIRTYLQITTPNGVTEVYRTRQPQGSHSAGQSTIQLDHAICEVGDWLVDEAIKEEKTVTQAISTAFSHYGGDKWQLGAVTASETVVLDCDHDNILEVILSVLAQAPQYYLTFDFSTNPWTVSVAQKSNTVTAEGRLSRNISDVVVRRDDKDLCTRVYVEGLTNGYMDADTISTYGIVERQTGSGNLTPAQAEIIATAYLNAHKHPKLSVEISGDDLSDITGEALDSFVVGKLFRLTIPEDNLVVEDYITKVTFPDIDSPSANIIIGDDLDPTINFLQEQASRGKSGGRSSRQLEKDNQVIHTEVYATGSMLYSYIEQTATYIMSAVNNVESSLGSTIVQTAEQIYSEVHASNSELYSFVSQTATNIRSVVESYNEDLHSEIEQTKSMIRSAVWTANSTVYTYVQQTASYILDHVGNRSGSKVIASAEKPVDSQSNPLNVGDLWIDGEVPFIWDEMEGTPWIDYDPTHPEYDWSQFKGRKVYVWKDGDWQLALDETTFAEDTDILKNKEQISLIAYNQKIIDGEWRSNVARLDVRADQISANVEERVQQIGSNITQTATQIRSEVHAANSQLYSAIEQTATSIRSYVTNAISNVGSEILQTANQIRSEVHAADSMLFSYIDQTATYIRQEVKNTESGLNSRITQTANQIRSEVNSSFSNMSSRITQNANNIELKVSKNGVISSINQTAESITIDASKININGLVSALAAKNIGCASLETQNSVDVGGNLSVYGYIYAGSYIWADSVRVGSVSTGATWKSKTVITGVDRSNTRNFVYAKNGNIDNLDTMIGSLCTGVSSSTIYYLGR